MNTDNRGSLLRQWMSMPNDSTAKIITVAVGVCLICSILVSATAVLLRPVQQKNEALSRQKEILKVAGLYQPGVDIAQAFKAITIRYVDLHSGDYVDPELAQQQVPEPIPDDQDIAGIGQRLRYQAVYTASIANTGDVLVLPISGKGLWSTIHGFLALKEDANTIKAVTFYDHAETPGLGGEISNPSWQAKWQGKNLVAMHDQARLKVIKGHVDPASHHASTEIDGLSGATLTANGINHMIRYWMGQHGYGPYLARLRTRTAQENDS